MGKKSFSRVENLIIFIVVVCFFWPKITTVSFNPDESHWISASSVFEAYFGGEFKSPIWEKSYMILTQPPLARYVIGVSRWIGGYKEEDLNLPWVFEEDKKTNIEEGRMPSQGLLWWSRLPMILLAATSILIGFMLLKSFIGRVAAYAWLILCLTSSYLPKTLTRAMGESTLLVCIAGTLIIAYFLMKVSDDDELNKTSTLYIGFLIFGILVGLAESSKLNGLTVIAAGFVIAILIAFRMVSTRTLKIRFALISILTLLFSSQLVFVLLNPFLWKEPLIRSLTMLSQRLYEMNGQQILYPDESIRGFSERISILADRIFQSYASIHYQGAIWINIFLYLIGFSFLCVKSYHYLRRQFADPGAIAILSVGLATSIPALFTPLDWDRYYLFPVFFSTLTIAIGIWVSVRYGYHLIRKKMR